MHTPKETHHRPGHVDMPNQIKDRASLLQIPNLDKDLHEDLISRGWGILILMNFPNNKSVLTDVRL